VTPYRKQAELLQYLIQDAGLKDLVRAGTVHRFQGLEFEVVIFDTVESRPCSPIEYTNGVWGSKAMRLVNVAVTRPKHKLIIVANADYIQKRFARDSTLSLALREAKGADSIQSHEVIGITLPPLSETLRYLLQDHDYEMLHRETLSSTSQYELKLLNENSFYSLFQTDVSTARKQIIIFSPFLTPRRTAKILPLLSERLQAGVKVIVITKPVDESNTTAEEAEPLLKDTRIELRNLSGMHEKLVLIDEEIVYIGSLNVLSHANSTEIMLRVKSPGFVKEVWSITNRNGVKKDTRDAFAPNSIVPGPDIVLSRSELPKSVCEKCGNTMIVKIGVNGAFYGCTDFPACRQSEDISEKQLSGLKQLINVHCDNCGGSTPMRIKTYRKDAWLECSAITPCGFQRHIKII